MKGRILVIAGSDSGGGAGIQADMKTVTMLGGFAMTAVTALTAQNTVGVFGVLPIEAEFVSQQIRVVIDDIGVDAIKTGMLHSASVVEAVVESLSTQAAPLIVDPVIIAKSGTRLIDPAALAVLRKDLLPIATLLTPNAPEASELTGLPLESAQDVQRVAMRLLEMGPRFVLIKGGHLPGDDVVDTLFWSEGSRAFRSPRQNTRSTHGTGCTLASAIATGVAQGLTVEAATERALTYVARAIAFAPGFGAGNGPLNHAHPIAHPLLHDKLGEEV